MSVGSVFLDIVPRIVGLSSTLARDAVAPSEKAGTEAGKTFADSFAKSVSTGTASVSASVERSVRAAQTAVEAASTRIVEARNKELDAADRVRIAETKLAEARAKYAADSSQIVAAEARVEAAKRNQELASTRVVGAESVEAKAKADLIARNTELQASEAKAAEASAASADAAQKGWLSKLTGGLGVGKAVSSVAGIASAFAVGDAIKSAGDYQQALTKLVTTAGAGIDQTKALGQGMLDLAGKVGISAQELAGNDGMYLVESSLPPVEQGAKRTADALNILTASAEGARQEGASLHSVTDAVSTALHDYHLPASDAANVTSQLITGVSHAKVNFDEFTASLHSVTPIAAAAHIPLADIIGSLGAMTASGMSADQASQNLGASITYLAKGSMGPARAELASFGIDAQQLADNLGTTGISGALQQISTAILQHMGPSGTVMLDTFKNSIAATNDLQSMLKAMPPNVAKLSQGLLDGSTGISDYTKAVKGMGGEAGAQGLQFLSLYKASDGFNQMLKSGGPDVQNYTGALARATGTQDGMRTALMLTGENAKATNDAIKDIAASSAQADGNIKGWSEVQSNFNQQAAETVAQVKAWAIEAGQHLLPVLSGLLQWVNGTAIPGLKSFGSGVGDLVHWFTQLPGPVKDAALAMAAFKVADMLGWVDSVKSAIVNFGSKLGELGGQLRTASGAMGVLKSAGSGVLNMFGGPWGVAIAGATAAVGLLDSAMQHNTDQVNNWGKALAAGGQAAADATKQMNSAPSAWDRFSFSLTHWGSSIGQIGTQTKEAQQAQKDYLNSLSPTDKAVALVSQAENQLAYDIQKHGKASQEVKRDTENYNAQLIAQKILSKDVSDAEQTQIDKTNQLANAQLASVSSSLGLAQANATLADGIAQYNADANDGQHSTKQLADESNNLAQQAILAAQAAGKQASDQAKANGITDDGTLANKAIYDSLKKAADQITGPGHDALVKAMDDLQKTTIGSGTLADTVSKMGATVAQTWDDNTAVLKSATDQQIKDLEGLGYTVKTLPNGKVMVTADTGPAAAQMQALVDSYRNYSININPQGMALTTEQRNHLYGADGGIVHMYANGGIEHMRGDVAQVVRPGTLRVIGDNPVADEAFIPLNSSDRSHKILGEAAKRMGYSLSPMADGGLMVTESARFSDAYIAKAQALIAQMGAMAKANASAGPASIPGNRADVAAIVQAMAAARGWGSGAEWNALSAVINRESGWNPNAANPTSSARGLFQKMTSVNGPVESTVEGQTAWGLNYIGGRYGDPIGAWNHELSAGWYDSGGWLKNGQVGVNTSGQPEPVFSAAQWKILEGNLLTGGAGKTVNGMVVHGDVVITDTEQQARDNFQRAAQAESRFASL